MKFSLLRKLFILDAHEKKFIDFSKEKWETRHSKESLGEVLVDAMLFHPYIFQTSYTANIVAKVNACELKTIVTEYGCKWEWLYKYCYPISKLGRLYSSFGCKKGLNYYIYEKRDYSSEAKLIVDQFESKMDLVGFIYNEIRIGDLIYDSYLRKYGVATVKLTDPKLIDLVADALRIYSSCEQYLSNNNVVKVLLSHAVYVQYGILARLAVARGIDVYMFSKWNVQVVHKLTRQHFLQTNNHLAYRERFIQLDNKAEKLAEARVVLEHRMSGGIDSGTSYMKMSAYGEVPDLSQKVFKNTNKPRLLIMLHCFFDSPHIYKGMLFADFYEWLDFTLSTVEGLDFDVYVKPHPNGLVGNEEIINYFIEKYPTINFISKTITNRQILSEGVNAVVTVYGTVAHEFSYAGLPVITAGDNPHSAYDFCYHAKNVNNYAGLLRDSVNLTPKLGSKEVEEFFYMHYLAPSDGRLEGNNDLFGLGRKSAERTVSSSSVLNEFIYDAYLGKYDSIEKKILEALGTTDHA